MSRAHDIAFGTRFALASLATWRVSHLVVAEDGPGDVVVRARARLGDSLAGQAMDCFACASVWVAAPASLALARRPRDVVVTWLALSGAACLLERGGNDPKEHPDSTLGGIGVAPPVRFHVHGG